MNEYVTGIDDVDDALEGMEDRVLAAARSIVEDSALLVATEAKSNGFRSYPGGRTVSTHKPWNPAFKSHIGRVYYSFAPPFQAAPPKPTRRSGLLQASINLLTVTRTGTGWMSTAGTPLKYANYVEYGTSRMAKEPFMEDALERSLDKVNAIASAAWDEATRV